MFGFFAGHTPPQVNVDECNSTFPQITSNDWKDIAL